MENRILSKVFMWLGIGMLVTFGIAYLISTNVNAIVFLFTGSKYWLIFIGQIILSIWLSTRIRSVNSSLTKVLYILYAILTGISFASIFLIYQISSIIFIFLIAAMMFGIFAMIGKRTNIDLSKLGTILFMGLLGIIVLELLDIFIFKGTLEVGICIIGLVIFFGYTAYDMQKIKRLTYDNMDEDNIAVIGAFELYLDFINIFLKLLQLFEKEKN